MHGLKQIRRIKKLAKQRKEVIVCPPPDQQIESYARQVCKKLSKECQQDYSQTDVVAGFTQFMKLAARMQAKQIGATYGKAKRKRR